MKVLIVNHFPLEGSGSGVYTKNLAMQLNRMGHDVKVIFPENYRTNEEKFQTHEILFSNGKNKEFDIPFNFPCFTSHPRSNNTFYKLNKDEIELYVSKFKEAIDFEIESFKPDIIHAQHLWITPYVSSLTDIKYVVTVHGTDLKGFVKDDRYHKYALNGAQSADKVITISREVDNETKKLYKISDDKRVMISNGYNKEIFNLEKNNRVEILNNYDIDHITKYLVTFAGKLTHFKGVDVLLKASKIYEKKLKNDVTTIIIGNGELYGELNRLKTELQLQNVFFVGHVNQVELAKLYNVSDVNIVPSRNEPFGLVAIEAMACGAPVIGTNQGGLKDIVTDEVGKLVEVEDDIDLADAIIYELEERKSSERRIIVNKYVSSKFSLEKSIEKVVEVYKEVCRRNI